MADAVEPKTRGAAEGGRALGGRRTASARANLSPAPDAPAPTSRRSAGARGADPFALAFRTARTAMVLTDPRQPDHPITAVNDAFVALTGYAPPDVLGRNCRFLQGPGTDRGDVRRIGRAIARGEGIEVEILNYRKTGAPFRNQLALSPVRDESGTLVHYFASLRDVGGEPAGDALEQEVARRTRELQAALDRKSALLQDVDHRVKNSLQTVVSLILLKARRAGDGAAREALHSMAERVGALSTAHRLLDTAGDVARFDIGECIADLAADLGATLAPGRIALDLSVEAVPLPADKAAPAALLVGELLTNGFKHAYPGGGRGRLGVSVARTDGGVRIVVEDKGVGSPAGAASHGLGRTLIDMLARQLRATVAFENARPGTRVVVSVPLAAGDVAA